MSERHFGHPGKPRARLFPLWVSIGLILSAPLIVIGIGCVVIMWGTK